MISRIIINNKIKYIKYRLPFTKSRYLIYWYPNCTTNIHGHENNCKFIVLKGNLREYLYSSNDSNNFKSINRLIKPLTINTINDEIGYHKINNDNSSSISYHHYY